MSHEQLTVNSVMHPFPQAIGIHENLEVAKKVMAEHGIRHLPVRRGGNILGILSDRDISYMVAQKKRDPKDILIEESYIDDPYVVEPDVPLQRVVRRMASDRIGCAIVAHDDKLLGIFTTVDACRVLSDILAGSLPQE